MRREGGEWSVSVREMRFDFLSLCSDAEFADTFLLTFSSFMTSEQLLASLISRSVILQTAITCMLICCSQSCTNTAGGRVV